MKGTIKKVLILSAVLLSYATISFAGETVPFFYNVLPVEETNSIIDKNTQSTISFDLYEQENQIYYNNEIVRVNNKHFEIDISNLSGKQTLVFKNDNNETAQFTYYICDENGLVKDYVLSNKKSDKTYVKTIDGIKVIYTDKDKKALSIIEKIITNIPNAMKLNVKEIQCLPYSIPDNTAAITKNNRIYTYSISRYSSLVIKHILLHEISHTWANRLMKEKVIDYSYTDYSKAVMADKKSVTAYSEKYNNREIYSEDFAESVALYLSSQRTFETKYQNRANYIENLLNNN